jgi:aspartyl-tRNA(Asn)/glutamyl-tRNA(Gln) amidotransferase subunit B
MNPNSKTSGDKLFLGLETHVELKTEQKMFCGCSAAYFGAAVNTHTCPVCLGMPGALPVPNLIAVKWTILIGLAFNCQINWESFFERKHYFYPDLAKGYQISQYQQPLCYGGYLKVNNQKIRINRIHLEEDTGKLIHGTQTNGQPASYVDFNWHRDKEQ